MKRGLLLALSVFVGFGAGYSLAASKPRAPASLREVEKVERLTLDITGVTFELNEPRVSLTLNGSNVKVMKGKMAYALAVSRSHSVLYIGDYALFAERMEDRSPRVLVTSIKFRR